MARGGIECFTNRNISQVVGIGFAPYFGSMMVTPFVLVFNTHHGLSTLVLGVSALGYLQLARRMLA